MLDTENSCTSARVVVDSCGLPQFAAQRTKRATCNSARKTLRLW